MKKLRSLPLVLTAALLLSLVGPILAGQHWPSMRYAGTGTYAGSSSDYAWEAARYDLVLAGGTDSLVVHKQNNPGMPEYTYEFLRYLNPLTEGTPAYLQDYAESHGGKFEDMFIHFSEDTVLKMENGGSGFSGDRFFRGWQYANSSYRHRFDWGQGDAGFTFGTSVGEIFYFGMHDRFDEVNFKFTVPAGGSWSATWEYWNGAWAPLVMTDGTNGLRQNGRLTFVPPSNWVRSTVNNDKLFWIRLRVTQTGTAPQFDTNKGIRCADYIPLVDATNRYYRIYGWDEAADANHDGYLDASEWPRRAANKNARFKYWSRMPGRNAMDNLTWQTNAGNTLFREALTSWVKQSVNVSYSGYTYDGVLLDDFIPDFNYWLYSQTKENPISGGAIYEYPRPGQPNRTPSDDAYDAAIVGALSYMRQQLNAIGKKVTINSPRWPEAERNCDVTEAERGFFSSTSFDHIASVNDYYGLSVWLGYNHSVGATSVLQHQSVMCNWLGDTVEVRDRDNYFGLAVFYLVQNPALDYFTTWYGSYYTSPSAPKYFPAAVAADIGRPTGVVPSGYTAVSGVDNTMFVLATGTDPVSGKPFKVGARDYSRGLVLAKPKADFAPDNATVYGSGSATTHNLPVTPDNPGGRYYLVRVDGSVETTPRTSVTLRNAEGAILIKETSSSTPNVSITMSQNYPDLARLSSGTEITYTMTCRNNGSAAANNVVVSNSLPARLSYVANTTKLNGTTVSPDPISGNTVSVRVGTLAAGQTATITLQARVN